jgi:ABC-type bacteriocin/lantibiotic exporter with double-glycine peptidase domain
MLQNVANLGVGMILAFIYSWTLTLIALAFVPFIIISGFLQTYLLIGFANKVRCNTCLNIVCVHEFSQDKTALEEAGKVNKKQISEYILIFS